MKRILSLAALFLTTIYSISDANEIDYCSCMTIDDVIVRETLEITATHFTNYGELA